MGEYLRTKEAAELLQIKLRTLYRIIADRLIPFYKPGGKLILFKKVDIEEYIRKNRIQTSAEVETELFENLKLKRK